MIKFCLFCLFSYYIWSAVIKIWSTEKGNKLTVHQVWVLRMNLWSNKWGNYTPVLFQTMCQHVYCATLLSAQIISIQSRYSIKAWSTLCIGFGTLRQKNWYVSLSILSNCQTLIDRLMRKVTNLARLCIRRIRRM